MWTATVLAALLAAQTEPASAPQAESAAATQTLIVVVGAQGTEEYGNGFRVWADNWVAAGKKGEAKVVRVDGSGDKPDRELLKTAIEAVDPASQLWIVLIGHGTFDQRSARFNLVGPDVSAKELAEWIPKEQRTAIVNCASASAPFINRLSHKNRVIVSATKSGVEFSYARFGQYISDVIGDGAVDLDKDGQTSLLEAWLVAARRTQDFYSEDGRLATEHALIDDNGDERGTRYDAFVGVRPVSKATGGKSLDGYRAHQWHLVKGDFERRMPARLVAERDELELAVIRLRENRSEYREEDYYRELESLLIPLATLYSEVEQASEAK